MEEMEEMERRMVDVLDACCVWDLLLLFLGILGETNRSFIYFLTGSPRLRTIFCLL
jgi:hypothetical protein